MLPRGDGTGDLLSALGAEAIAIAITCGGTRVKLINDEVITIDRRIGEPLGSTVLAEAVADGLDWKSWNVPTLRYCLRLLVAEVLVAPWPEDVPRGTPRRKYADPDAHRVRLEALEPEAIERRARIVLRP